MTCIFGILYAITLCGQTGQPPVLLDLPPVKQPYNLCLGASVSMVLKYWGVDLSPQAIADQVPVYRDGITGLDLQPLLDEKGFRGFLIQPPFEDLLKHLAKGRPLVIGLPARGGSRHAMVLIGFDSTRQLLSLNDPASGKRRSIDYQTFARQWERAQRWTFLIVPR
jgi:ABC-type bacteriocin/lantibiotic exporter with double-glycine peptidase domain